MSLTARFRSSADRLIRHFGDHGTVTLRRPHSLKSAATGGAPTLLVRVAHLAGVSVIDMDATGLVGTLPAGAKFTIAGVAGTYTTSADTTAASGILTDVPFTPVLAGNAANDAAVTLTQEYGELTYYRSRDEFTEEDGVDLLDRNERKVHLSAVGEETAPAKGDILYSGDGGEVEYVTRVIEHAPGGTATAWTLFVGSQPR